MDHVFLSSDLWANVADVFICITHVDTRALVLFAMWVHVHSCCLLGTSTYNCRNKRQKSNTKLLSSQNPRLNSKKRKWTRWAPTSSRSRNASRRRGALNSEKLTADDVICRQAHCHSNSNIMMFSYAAAVLYLSSCMRSYCGNVDLVSIIMHSYRVAPHT